MFALLPSYTAIALMCRLISGWLQPGILFEFNRHATEAVLAQKFFTSTGERLVFGLSNLRLTAPGYTLRMRLHQARPVPPAVHRVSASGPASHFGLWRTFTGVSYHEPWPGVDVIYEPVPNGIIKSFYSIRANFTKTTLDSVVVEYNLPLELDAQGRLVLRHNQGSFIESAPVAWQQIRGVRKNVSVHFQKRGADKIGFVLSGYDSRFALTIDPSLAWTTFIGRHESEDDVANNLIVDGSGNAFVVGYSNGPWPEGGSPQRAYTRGNDGFVAKLASDGTLAWNTFLGGTGDDELKSVCLDGSSNLFLTGYSTATWGSPLAVYKASDDAFVAKLDASGNLAWNTFLGGLNIDRGYGVTLDHSGNLWLAGYSGFTWATPLRAHGGGSDAFAAKLTASGSLLWNTFLGGTGTDSSLSLAVDASDNCFLAGSSSAAWGTPLRAFAAGQDAFAAKLDTSGNLLWSLFAGGAATDAGASVAVDGSGNCFLGGSSSATWGAPISAYTSGNDIFASKIDPSGALLWHTFLGGTGSDTTAAIAVDTNNALLLTGASSVSWGTPLHAFTSSNNDIFAAKLDANGTLLWNTFQGGSGSDLGIGVVAHALGSIFIAGQSSASWGSPQREFTGSRGWEVTAVKLDTSGNLLWNSFLGGAGSEINEAMALDASGNILIAGVCTAGWGSPKRAFSGDYDVFAAQLDNSSNPIWLTFLGGGNADFTISIVGDASGNIFVGGNSVSNWGAPQRPYSGNYDVFAAKIDANGNLLWNTFAGGGNMDSGGNLVLDNSNNILLTGYSASSWGSPISAFTSGEDGFVAKFNPSGSLLWNTFVGGTNTDRANGMAIDGSGNILLGGQSGSSWGTPVSAYILYNDAIVVKLDPNGTRLWNTFIGGNSEDYGWDIAVDSSGNILLVGESLDTWGSPIRSKSIGNDAFAVKIATDGTLVWNTFFGGNDIDSGNAIAADANGQVLVLGKSKATWGNPEFAYAGNDDVFAVRCDSSGNLLWHTFLGGTGADSGRGILAAPNNALLICGQSSASWGNPTVPGAPPQDAFIVKLESNSPTFTPTASPSPSSTPTGSPTPSHTPSASPTPSPSPTLTHTPEGSLTALPSASSTPTQTLSTPTQSASASFAGESKELLRILNPIIKNSQLQIATQLLESRDLTITLYGLNGSLALNRVTLQPAGNSVWAVDLGKLSQGSYLALIEGRRSLLRQRIVVLR